jgi:hypothetical protein
LKVTPDPSLAPAEKTTVDYAYTADGQRAQVAQTVGTARTVRYAYDRLQRLRASKKRPKAR